VRQLGELLQRPADLRDPLRTVPLGLSISRALVSYLSRWLEFAKSIRLRKKKLMTITFYSEMHRETLDGLVHQFSEHGTKLQKLEGAPYGDVTYLHPGSTSSSASTLVDDVAFSFHSWVDADGAKKIVAEIVKLM
jgi:hypothetical protein